MGKRVILIGLRPDVVNYDKWPGLTPETLEAGLRRDEAALRERGFDAGICFVDHGETAEDTIRAALAEAPCDVVLIGAGVRTDPEEFLLFERLVNLVHVEAPQARLCFNTGPTDSVAAVERWA
jgi:hypothetical protein